jgi:predicted RNase H-like nuclease (RuvC/YqgF family)
MKIITTAIVMFSSVLSFAQTGMESGNSAELKRVSDRAIRASEEVNTLRNEVSALRMKNNDLQLQLNAVEENVSAEITRSQELQAQNERAMNLALDEFKKKFEEQNKTVEGVQASLDDKFNKQLIFFVLGLVLFVIIAMVMTKSATRKGLNQAKVNWNEFQEYLLKKIKTT